MVKLQCFRAIDDYWIKHPEESPDCAKQGTEGNLRLATAGLLLLKSNKSRKWINTSWEQQKLF